MEVSTVVRNLADLGRDVQKIYTRLISNQSLLKLLYYTDKDPLSHEDLTEKQIQDEIFEKLIKVVPRVGPKETAASIIVLRVVNGRANAGNDEFKDFMINIEVFVPLTQWMIKDPMMRPFSIMGQIHQSLNNKIIDGMGKITGGDFAINFLTEEISCYEMSYYITAYD